jgi:hypothetical protein
MPVSETIAAFNGKQAGCVPAARDRATHTDPQILFSVAAS